MSADWAVSSNRADDRVPAFVYDRTRLPTGDRLSPSVIARYKARERRPAVRCRQRVVRISLHRRAELEYCGPDERR
jgi:hypothetical protein